MIKRLTTVIAVAAVATVLAAGCTSSGGDQEPSPSVSPAVPVVKVADDNLQVQVSATAFAAAKGTSGRAGAEQVAAKGAGGFGFSGFGRGEPVPGLGDEAFVDAHVKGDRVSAQVLVRVDNAVVSAYAAEYVIGDGVPSGLTATIRKGATAVAADAVAELARRR